MIHDKKLRCEVCRTEVKVRSWRNGRNYLSEAWCTQCHKLVQTFSLTSPEDAEQKAKDKWVDKKW